MKIMDRTEFIKEVYEPMVKEKEEKEYIELQMINEGLLTNLFGKIRNILVDDWKTIKGGSDVIKYYKEVDDSLTGYTMMKMFKREQCNKIRQELVDFASDWYDYKMDKAKKEKTDPVPAESMKIKNETLRENLEDTEKNIKSIANDDTQMTKWADILMQAMKTVINRVIANEIKDEEKKNEIEQSAKKELDKIKEQNKKAEELQNKQLKEVSKDRETYIKRAGASNVIDGKLTGDKAAENLCGEFKKLSDAIGTMFESVEIDDIDILNESNENMSKIIDVLKNDKTLGFNTIFKDEISAEKVGKKFFKPTYILMNKFYTALAGELKKFENVPSQSVQAMCISINSFIKNMIYGASDESVKPSDDEYNLMAKCAIVSNGVISYNLPVDGSFNYFTKILNMISEGKFDGDNAKDKSINSKMLAKAKELMKEIEKRAEKLKTEGEKKFNDENAKLDK